LLCLAQRRLASAGQVVLVQASSVETASRATHGTIPFGLAGWPFAPAPLRDGGLLRQTYRSEEDRPQNLNSAPNRISAAVAHRCVDGTCGSSVSAQPAISEEKNMRSKLQLVLCMLALALPAMAVTTTIATSARNSAACVCCDQCTGNCCDDCASGNCADCCDSCQCCM